MKPRLINWFGRVFRMLLCRRDVVKTEITFTGIPYTKKNSLRRLQRGKRLFSVPSEAYQKWESSHVAELRDAITDGSLQPLTPPYTITYVFHPKDKRRHDLSNKIEGINDALVKGGILQDDNWFQLVGMAIICGEIDKKNPRVEVIIESANRSFHR